MILIWPIFSCPYHPDCHSNKDLPLFYIQANCLIKDSKCSCAYLRPQVGKQPNQITDELHEVR